jgi:hypothetical protein
VSSTSEAARSDGQLLRHLRQTAGWSLAQLASVVHYDKGYLSRVENDRQTISVALATACDRALNSEGELTARAKRPPHALVIHASRWPNCPPRRHTLLGARIPWPSWPRCWAITRVGGKRFQ